MRVGSIIVSLMLAMFITGCGAPAAPEKTKEGIVLFGTDSEGTGKAEEETYMELIEEIADIGFNMSDPHERINDGYEEKYGSTTLDNLGFFSIANDEFLNELFIKYPAIGGFSPFNLHVFKKKEEPVTWVGHLKPETMADIVGLQDPELRAKFVKSFEPLDAKIQSKMKSTKTKVIKYAALPENPMMTFTVDIPEDVEDMQEWADEFQGKYEAAYVDNIADPDARYIIAGFKDFKYVYEDLDMDFPFEQYWVYSLCHFKFSNAIFNTTPEAGVFAPCAVYMYIKEGEHTLNIGMPKLESWAAVSGIDNPDHLKLIHDLDNEIINIMINELGAKGTNGTAPSGEYKKAAAAEVKEAMTYDSMGIDKLPDGKLNTYYVAKSEPVNSVKAKLEKAGFEIVTVSPNANGSSVIVFTNATMKSLANASGKGMLATALRALVDEKNGYIRFTNPKYFAKAYLQKTYKDGCVDSVEKSLKDTFGTMKLSKDVWEENGLGGYHFMIGMPYYEDQATILEGSSVADVVAKFKSGAGENLAYSVKLADDRYVLGLRLSKKTEKFVPKIGDHNAGLIPWPVLVEMKDGKAVASTLQAEYHIAINYPLLDLGGFASIMTVPGAVLSDLRNYVK